MRATTTATAALAAAQAITLLHGQRRLESCMEVVPGIYIGGQNAAVVEVTTGGLSQVGAVCVRLCVCESQRAWRSWVAGCLWSRDRPGWPAGRLAGWEFVLLLVSALARGCVCGPRSTFACLAACR